MRTCASFWKIAATVRKGRDSRKKLKLSSALPMDMSTRPAMRSCAGFTCGPPVRSSTSSPAARYSPAACAW